MIFVTVGTQLAFDRLVSTVDQWAFANRRDDVYAQIGPSKQIPRNIGWSRFLAPAEFERRVEACGVLVAHAGMGSILTALELRRPIIIMPRRFALGEHRNDHQMSTAQRLTDCGVHVAMNETELTSLLMRGERLSPPRARSGDRLDELATALSNFIRVPASAPQTFAPAMGVTSQQV